MARARLLHVPRHEPRQTSAGRALRLDLQPKFRGPPGLQGPHPSRLAGDGGGRRNRRTFRGRARVEIILCEAARYTTRAAGETAGRIVYQTKINSREP